MDALLDSIRIAVTDGASDVERQRGAVACRALAQALDGAIVGPDVVAPPALGPTAPGGPDLTTIAPFTPAVAGLPANPFAGMTADQVLDLAIAKLRSAVGDAAATPLGQPFQVPLVPVPRRL